MKPEAARRRALLWAPVALLAAFQAYLSSQSSLPDVSLGLPAADKLHHFAYFGLMGLFAVRASRFGEGWSPFRTWIVLLLGALVVGSLDELHQAFVPSRFPDPLDTAADLAGAAVALLVSERLWVGANLERPAS